MDNIKNKPATGSPLGLVIVLVIGFVFYWFLSKIGGSLGSMITYQEVVNGIDGNLFQQLLWLLMGFTEPLFYGGILAGAAVVIGGFVAYVLAMKNSRFAGFDVCYGQSSMWPWVLASQLLSVGLAIFVFRYTRLFELYDLNWVGTFVSLVGAPPSLMLMYGPSVPVLLVSSALSGLLATPVATWLSVYITGPIRMPGVIANVLAMAITGVLIGSVLRVLPWVKKMPVRSHRRLFKTEVENVYTAKWFVRRCLAEFSEAPFYGNEVTSLFILIAVTIEWSVGNQLLAGGAGGLPEIILSQFVGAAIGVFLYASKFEKGGWYATYVPVVSVGPAAVLFFGGSATVAVVAGILGGFIGAPLADYFARRLPEGIHPTVANVMSMAVSTFIVITVLKSLHF